jgi:hypothetical protein
VITGLGPHLGALYYSFMVIASLFDGGSISDLWDVDEPFVNLIYSAILLGPGVLAVVGGLAGVVTYWMLLPPKAERTPKPLAADEYLVVSGRLTTAPVERTT